MLLSSAWPNLDRARNLRLRSASPRKKTGRKRKRTRRQWYIAQNIALSPHSLCESHAVVFSSTSLYCILRLTVGSSQEGADHLAEVRDWLYSGVSPIRSSKVLGVSRGPPFEALKSLECLPFWRLLKSLNSF